MSKVNKAIKKFNKGFKQLSSVVTNVSLEELQKELTNTAGFFIYPTPNSPIAKPAAWTIVPVDAPYNRQPPPGVGDPGKPYQETMSAVKTVKKAAKNFNKGFKRLKKTDEDLFDKLGLLEAKQILSQYAQDLVDGLLGRERVLEDQEYYSSDITL